MKRMILCFLLSLALAAVSFAQEPADSLQRVSREAPAEAQASGEQTAEQLWNKANTAYINGDFHAAADTYEELLSRGVSSMKLYYNLGNAYFKDDRIGKAILYYNRALRLAPGNDDIRYNLSVAEARTKDNIEDIRHVDARHPPHDGMHGVEPAFARIAGLYAGAVFGLPAGTAHFAAQGGFLRHGRRGAAVHADHVVRRGGTP